jgi:hypothetical protein
MRICPSSTGRDHGSTVELTAPERASTSHVRQICSIGEVAAIDFFTVPTITFRVLSCFVVWFHNRRRVAHFNVTVNPTVPWTAQ